MPRKFYKEDNEAIPAIKFALNPPPGFSEITNQEEIKELYLRQYQYRISDGKEYVQDFTADTYIKVLNGVYADTQAFELEAHMKNILIELNNGCWLTAQNTNSNLVLRGVYDQVLKDEIQEKINLYVLENY